MFLMICFNSVVSIFNKILAVTKAKKHSLTSSYQILKRDYKATFLSLDRFSGKLNLVT